MKKTPYTVAAAQQPFDVTKPQPQLYVASSFPHLMEVLEEFADTLSLRKGGKEGIHTEHLGYLLSDLQYMQRTYPNMEW